MQQIVLDDGLFLRFGGKMLATCSQTCRWEREGYTRKNGLDCNPVIFFIFCIYALPCSCSFVRDEVVEFGHLQWGVLVRWILVLRACRCLLPFWIMLERVWCCSFSLVDITYLSLARFYVRRRRFNEVDLHDDEKWPMANLRFSTISHQNIKNYNDKIGVRAGAVHRVIEKKCENIKTL